MFKKERLTELREINKLTQQQLADKIGISHVSVYNYEAGKKEPGKITLKKLADFFHVSLDYLLGRSDHAELTEDLQGELKNVLQRLDQLKEDEREAVLKSMLKVAEAYEGLIKKK